MTKPQRATPHARGQFQSTPSVWRETVFSVFYGKILPFQSTPSVWRETQRATAQCLTVLISIHSLRVEGDVQFKVFPLQVIQFQSTPSVWRETVMHIFGNMLPCLFQSTPSVWRETPTLLMIVDRLIISIHSLRVEGDRMDICSATSTADFNPLPPCGGRLPESFDNVSSSIISIHSLRVEGDQIHSCANFINFYFNPLPPCGGRHVLEEDGVSEMIFQSTPSVWRETCQ